MSDLHSTPGTPPHNATLSPPETNGAANGVANGAAGRPAVPGGEHVDPSAPGFEHVRVGTIVRDPRDGGAVDRIVGTTVGVTVGVA